MTGNPPRLIRFIRAEVQSLSDESCEATVELELRGVGRITATARGPNEEHDRLRTVARATSDALSEAFDEKAVKVRVMSIQPVALLTQHTLLVTLAVTRGADQRTLHGVCDASGDPVRAASLAVLNATNRFLDWLTD